MRYKPGTKTGPALPVTVPEESAGRKRPPAVQFLGDPRRDALRFKIRSASDHLRGKFLQIAFIFGFALAALLPCARAQSQPESAGPYDTLVIRGAILIDGTGAPAKGPVGPTSPGCMSRPEACPSGRASRQVPGASTYRKLADARTVVAERPNRQNRSSTNNEIQSAWSAARFRNFPFRPGVAPNTSQRSCAARPRENSPAHLAADEACVG